MNKVNLYIDMDDVLINSNEAIRKHYANVYKTEVPPVIREWDGTDVLTKAPVGFVEETFNTPSFSKGFWEYIKVKDGVYGVLNQLKDSGKYNLYICSICGCYNAINKIKFLRATNLDLYFDHYHLIVQNNHITMGKDFIKGIAIDDHSKNLVNNPYGILFMDNGLMPYNKDWKGAIATGWNNELIDTIEIYADMIKENRL